MGFNDVRDRRRKYLERLEILRAEARYDDECGEVFERKATPQEIEKYNKLNKHKKG